LAQPPRDLDLGHQAERMHLPGRFLTGFSQSLEKKDAIRVAQENGFAPVATIEDVLDRTWIFDAEFSGHGQEFAPDQAVSQQIMRLCGTDPFTWARSIHPKNDPACDPTA
jgi:3-deoxy-D-arabino-heptulosonate 7-phosphate (DAHP) synthase class II